MGLISRVSSRTYRNTLLLTFSPPSPALPQAKTKSPRSSNLLALTSKPTNSTKSSPNWTVKTLKTSSPKVWVSSPLFHLVVLPQLVAPLPPVMPLQLLREERILRRRRIRLRYGIRSFWIRSLRKKLQQQKLIKESFLFFVPSDKITFLKRSSVS